MNSGMKKPIFGSRCIQYDVLTETHKVYFTHLFVDKKPTELT